MGAAESWQGMRERCAALLRTSTGEDATELIDGQYHDRPGLLPILDAILGVLAEVGDVTVQARKTIISLVSPKRTFAVVQATTRTRVDLGVRLDDHQPGGRLLAAKTLGMANLRIALSSPADVGDEAIGLLKLAYQESVAPPKPRKPSARPSGTKVPLHVIIEGFDLPGRTSCPELDGPAYDNVHVALSFPGTGRMVDPVPGDAASARWELDINVRRTDASEFDFTGPCVRGDKTDRNLGLAWGNVRDDGTFQLFRGAKLRLVDVPADVLRDALAQGRPLLARVRLTDRRGNPICARLRSPDISWSLGRILR